MKIYLDFDGTVVEHTFPYIGKYNERSLQVIQKLFDAGHEIILNTYRTNIDVENLTGSKYTNHAIEYINKMKIQLGLDFDFSVSPFKILPTRCWNIQDDKNSNSIFIDDIRVGMPLTGKMVNFTILDNIFTLHNIYTNET